jgi:hypothetical protein
VVAYAIFDTPPIHGIPGIKELAQAGSEMDPPLVIATAQLLQVLDDSSVNMGHGPQMSSHTQSRCPNPRWRRHAGEPTSKA